VSVLLADNHEDLVAAVVRHPEPAPRPAELTQACLRK
jgi:hypothetical protein